MAKAVVCRKCEARDELIDRFRKDEHADTHGVYFHAEEGTPDPEETRSALASWAAMIGATGGSGPGDDLGMINELALE